MRHRVKVNKFNRDTKHRSALFKNLVRSLVEHGQIVTTEPKAKEVKRLADKLIGKARANSVSSRRVLHAYFGKRDVVNTLVERVAPLFPERISGFTRITPVGLRRGDNTKMVSVALVEKLEKAGSLKSGVVFVKSSTKEKKEKAVKPAKKATKVTKAPAKKAKKATK